MFILGLTVIAGATIYSWITGDWITDKWQGVGIAYAVGVYLCFSPVRRWLFGKD